MTTSRATLAVTVLAVLLLSGSPMVHAFATPAAPSVRRISSSRTDSSFFASQDSHHDNNNYPKSSINLPPNRRDVLALGSSLSVLFSATVLAHPSTAHAAAPVDKQVLTTLLARLRQVPTFCIVNTQGSPFMVINKQEAMAKGYAFTSMEGAVMVLGDAQTTAQREGYADIWADATIVTLPADIAVRLALTKKDRVPSRGGAALLGSIIEIIPTTTNRDDALLIDKRAFQDQGKTPLFYVDTDDLAAPDGSHTRPLFLQKQALLDAWNQQHPGQPRPPIRAIDLTYLFEAALRGYTERIPNGGNVSFVPDPEQVQMASKLRQEGLTMYNFDKMIV